MNSCWEPLWHRAAAVGTTPAWRGWVQWAGYAPRAKASFFPSGGLACISREPQGCSVKKKQLQLPFLGPDLAKQEGWLWAWFLLQKIYPYKQNLKKIPKKFCLTSLFSFPTQNMCTLEAELENLLGEFCIKMKGKCLFTFPFFLRNSGSCCTHWWGNWDMLCDIRLWEVEFPIPHLSQCWAFKPSIYTPAHWKGLQKQEHQCFQNFWDSAFCSID